MKDKIFPVRTVEYVLVDRALKLLRKRPQLQSKMSRKDLFSYCVDEKTLCAWHKVGTSYDDIGVNVFVDKTLFTCLMRFDNDVRVEC